MTGQSSAKYSLAAVHQSLMSMTTVLTDGLVRAVPAQCGLPGAWWYWGGTGGDVAAKSAAVRARGGPWA
jgi:hypothetical protein